jgi:hypothetical protein
VREEERGTSASRVQERDGTVSRRLPSGAAVGSVV